MLTDDVVVGWGGPWLGDLNLKQFRGTKFCLISDYSGEYTTEEHAPSGLTLCHSAAAYTYAHARTGV